MLNAKDSEVVASCLSIQTIWSEIHCRSKTDRPAAEFHIHILLNMENFTTRGFAPRESKPHYAQNHSWEQSFAMITPYSSSTIPLPAATSRVSAFVHGTNVTTTRLLHRSIDQSLVLYGVYASVSVGLRPICSQCKPYDTRAVR